MIAENDRFAFFDGDGGSGLVLSDYRSTLLCAGNESPAAFFAQVEAAADTGLWVALAADYALGGCFEPRVPHTSGAAPVLRAWLFGTAERLDAAGVAEFLASRLAGFDEYARYAGIADWQPGLDAAEHAAGVERIRRWIAAGDCYQINYTFPVDFRVYGHPLALYVRLRARQPVRYGCYIETAEHAILSFSPELFFERTGTRVVTRPMKGTAPRGCTAQDDADRRTGLIRSEKERAENIMIVNLLRNDLGRLARPGRVQVEALCTAEAYPTVWQMVSTVAADLPGVPLGQIFQALFPCGSITGAPKIRAMQRIAELELHARRLYTGALGWVAPGGDCRFNVAIRTVEVSARGEARLGIGGGIVIDARPESEYAECLLKARFLSGFDPGFELIETMRLENGSIALLELHLQRLAASASTLGFACDLPAVRRDLEAIVVAHPQGVRRVRLTLAHCGQYGLEAAPLREPPVPWSVVFSDEPLGSASYLLRHKTTVRSLYDRALAGLSATPDVFDVLFFNERGEVCEGARSNVFIERGGRLLTPPLSSGLLPGVMRRHLLDSGRAVEHILTRDDLLGARALYVGNALRGLLPVSLKI